MVSSCHMTSALGTLRSEGHVITILLKIYLDKIDKDKLKNALKTRFLIMIKIIYILIPR